ncbi:MAG: hypothetical protein A2044_03240, partial [Candidatus Firestonebacteria bacterium GWA2_43_8]
RIRIISVITDADLIPDPMYDGEPLCDKCMECVKHCPTDAFRKEVEKINTVEIGGKIFKFPKVNFWRCSWAENFGLDLALKIPDKVTEKTVLEHIEKYGQRGGEQGCCLKFCLTKDKRSYDNKYCAAPRRKKEIKNIEKSEMMNDIKKIFNKHFLDILAVGNKSGFKDNEFVHPKLHLPDAETVISIGIHVSEINRKNKDLQYVIKRKLWHAEFEIAHYLDKLGYSAITGTKIKNELVAQQLKIFKEDFVYSTIITSAKLPDLKEEVDIKKGNVNKSELSRLAKEQDADLTGFFTAARFKKASEELSKCISKKDYFYTEDKGDNYGPYVPKVTSTRLKLKTPEDHLSGAKSVMVVGMHYPDSAVDTAKVTPAETIGPYTFVQYESIYLLGELAFNIIKYLERKGYKATAAYDLEGLGSYVKSSRGMLPDQASNRFSTVLAGLAYIGYNGLPMTKEYGQRIRFISIITDCEFEDDPLIDVKSVCEKCDAPCIKACPVKAITGKKISMNLEGKSFNFFETDILRCDWAKRYGLSEKEGPEFYALKTETEFPEDLTPEKLVKAVSGVKWGVQKRHVNICEECLRVCKFSGSR